MLNYTGLEIDFSRTEPELWLNDKPALTGNSAFIAITALRQVLGACRRQILDGGFTLRYIGSQKLIGPGKVQRFLATQPLTQVGLYEYLVAA